MAHLEEPTNSQGSLTLKGLLLLGRRPTPNLVPYQGVTTPSVSRRSTLPAGSVWVGPMSLTTKPCQGHWSRRTVDSRASLQATQAMHVLI